MIKSAKILPFLVCLSCFIAACERSPQEANEYQSIESDSPAHVTVSDQSLDSETLENRQKDKVSEYGEDSADRLEPQENPVFVPITFDSNGRYTLQIESWRSEDIARNNLEVWKRRGFDQAYIMNYGEDSTGDIWFRIRLGRFSSHAMAQRQKESLQADFNVNSWIDIYE